MTFNAKILMFNPQAVCRDCLLLHFHKFLSFQLMEHLFESLDCPPEKDCVENNVTHFQVLRLFLICGLFSNKEGSKTKQINGFKKRKVYGVTRLVPIGQVTTYKAIADCLSCKSCQAVGQALKKNPWPIDCSKFDKDDNVNNENNKDKKDELYLKLMVPCHRVISSNLAIGGFSGKTQGIQIERKIKLLAKEGVLFKLNNENQTNNNITKITNYTKNHKKPKVALNDKNNKNHTKKKTAYILKGNREIIIKHFKKKENNIEK